LALSSFAALSADSLEQEVRGLVELVRLSRVTVLIAEEGSDKSAVLRSMVLPLLQEDRGGASREIAVLFDWWKKAPLAVLRARIDEALARAVGDAAYAMEDQPSAGLSARLAQRGRAFGCKFVIILDRFEEYLAAADDNDDIREFEAQFVEAVNSRTISAHFVLSLDERAAPRLARLHDLVPGLGDAQVRLSKVMPERAAPTGAQTETPADRLVGSTAPLAQAVTARTNPVASDVAVSRSRSTEHPGEIATAGEAVASHVIDYRGDGGLGPPAAEAEAASVVGRGTRRKSPWIRAATALVIVLAVVSLAALLGIRRAGDSERGPTAATVPPANTADSADGRPERETNAPAEASSTVAAAPEAPREPETPEPQVTVEKAAPATAPSSGSMAIPPTPERSSEAAGPLLYIIIGSEAQRAYAERIVAPLSERGIRVGGIRMVHGGPPVSDLRYFHSADRAEAATINRALDVIGRPAQRLRYIPGSESRQPRNQYELWLPAS
jgi:hypothetical protein